MLIVVAVVAGLLALGFLYEQFSRRREQGLPLTGRLVDVGGYRLHMTESGEGGPAVVIIPGAGESGYSWATVTKGVAQFTRVVAYDRAGLGSSDDGPAPDAVRTVSELRTLLERAGVPGPYVLVGHSLGGLIARLYALRYPADVAGLVLVDSTHEFLKDDAKFKQGFAAVGMVLKVMRVLSHVGVPRFLGQVLGVMPMYPERPYYQQQLAPEEYRRWALIGYRNVRRDGGFKEFDAVAGMLEEAARQMKSSPAEPQFGKLPLAVLTNPGFGEGWIEMHRELAARSTNSIHWISDRKGHSLQMPRPDLVIDAIRHVVHEATSDSRTA